MNTDERSRAAAAVVQRVADRSLTVSALAARAGVDQKTIRNLIAGRSWPTRDVQFRVEVALGWDLGDMTRAALGQEPIEQRSGAVDVDRMTDAEILADVQRLTAVLARRAARRERRDQLRMADG